MEQMYSEFKSTSSNIAALLDIVKEKMVATPEAGTPISMPPSNVCKKLEHPNLRKTRSHFDHLLSNSTLKPLWIYFNQVVIPCATIESLCRGCIFGAGASGSGREGHFGTSISPSSAVTTSEHEGNHALPKAPLNSHTEMFDEGAYNKIAPKNALAAGGRISLDPMSVEPSCDLETVKGVPRPLELRAEEKAPSSLTLAMGDHENFTDHGPAIQECLQIVLSSLFATPNPPAQEFSGPTLRKKRDHATAARMTPPSILTPRLIDDPLPASKNVWILHHRHLNTVIALGKTGVGWKFESKLWRLCKHQEQWVQIHRTFVEDNDVLCEDESGQLIQL